MGYHSIMFQHVAIAQCPLHNESLQDACSDCGSLIEPTFLSATENPFECPVCTSRLAHTVINGVDQQHGKWIDQMLGARRRVLADGSNAPLQERRLGDVPLRLRSAGSPAAARHYQRVCVWAYPQDSHWISFREQTHPVDRVPARDVPIRTWLQLSALQSATLSILQWLIEACWMHEKAALRLLGRLGRYPRGLRLNAHTSVVSVALYKVAAAYDLLAEMQLITQLRESGEAISAMAMSGKEVVRFGDSLWEYPQLDARLLQLEILGLFAKLLVQEGGKTFLDEVSWLDYPHPIEFAPSWHVESSARAPVARVRYRAAELDVERLLKRLWARALRFRHHDPVGTDDMWKHNHLDTLWHECMPSESIISLQKGEARRL